MEKMPDNNKKISDEIKKSDNVTNNNNNIEQKPAQPVFQNRGIQRVQFRTGTMLLSKFYSINSLKKKMLVAFILGVIFAILSIFLVENSGLYSGGSTSFFQGVARLVYSAIGGPNSKLSNTTLLIIYNLLFWGLYLVFNVSLMIAFWNKLDREFLIISLVFIITSQIVGIVFGAAIPGIENVFIIGDTTNVNLMLKEDHVQSIIFQPNIWPTKVYFGDSSEWAWSKPYFVSDLNKPKFNSSEYFDNRMLISNENVTRAFDLFLYAMVFSFVSSIINAILYSMGGSSAGTELISLYMSERKNIDVGHMLRIAHIVCMVTGIFLGSYISGIVAEPQYASTYASWQYFFSANLVASLIWIFLNAFLVNLMYPAKKMVQIQIFTNNLDPILTRLGECKYPHPTTIINTIGGYSRAKNNILTVICPISRMNATINVIRKIDERCLITITDIRDVDGSISVRRHLKTKAELEELEKKRKLRVEMKRKNRKTKKAKHDKQK